MAVVIPLAPRRRAQPAEASALPRTEPATILFFTGVRYERQGDPGVVAEAPSPRRPRVQPPSATSRPKRPRKATHARQPA